MEVAEKIGISQAQISRIEKAALRFIRRYYKDQVAPGEKFPGERFKGSGSVHNKNEICQ
jgi:hypothetical protein